MRKTSKSHDRDALIDAQLAAKGMMRTDGPGWYVTVGIEGPDGLEVYKVWACEAEAPRHARRPNPPLSEHMAHDDLYEIAQGLALRFVSDTEGGGDLLHFVRRLMKEVDRQAVALGPDAPKSLRLVHQEARMFLGFIRRELD